MTETPIGSPVIAVVGLTGTGKTQLAIDLAERFDGEIIGADSRQVYRHLDIGTAKPTPQERAHVPHHCVDHVDPTERYHLGRFLREARAAIDEIRGRGKIPIIVGGTGQYIWALLEGWSVPEVEPDLDFRDRMTTLALSNGPVALHERLAEVDPVAARRIDARNVRRVIRALEVQARTGRPISAWHDDRDPIPAIIVAPAYDLVDLDDQINARVDQMIVDGLVEETRALIDAGLGPAAPGLESIGYREVVQHFAGESSWEMAIEEIKLASRQLARAQAKWFRLDDECIRWCNDAATARVHIREALGA